jgi:hypothetical protein
MEFTCIFCSDQFPRGMMITAKCRHRYCTGCAKGVFLQSIKYESFYPPKCCQQPIPLPLVAKHMNPDELAAFQLATVEHATQNRVFCSNIPCNMFIITENIEPGVNRASCSRCGTDTCALCTTAYHPGANCPDDLDLRQTRELAQTRGWKTCSTCQRVVELRSGCNHIA